MNVVDSLVVTLGLDPAGWTKGQKEAVAALKRTETEATKTAKELEARGKQAAQFFSSVKTQVVALTAAFLGASGIKQFVSQVTTSDAALGRLSKNLGISARELAAWEGVADKFGSSGADIDAAFRNLAKMNSELNLTGTTAGLQGNAPLAHVLGNHLTQFLDKSTTAEQRMRLVQDGLSKLTQQDAQYWGQASGFSEQTINALRDTNTQMDSLLDKQRERLKRTQEDADAAVRLDQAWKKVADRFEDIGRSVLTVVRPALEGLLGFVEQHATVIAAVVGSIGAFLTGWGAAATVTGIMKVASALGIAAGAAVALQAAVVAVAAILTSWGINKLGELTDSGSWGSFLYDKMNPKTNAQVTQGLDKGDGPTGVSGKIRRPGAAGNGMGLLGLMQKLEGSGPNAVSPAGAIGRNQIMPATAALYAKKFGIPYSGREQLFDPAFNDMMAGVILKDLTQTYKGNTEHILANYNASPRATKKFVAGGELSTLPMETQKYIGHARQILGGASSHVNIQTMTVVTQASDADGVAKDLGPAMRREAMAYNAQAGMN